MIAPRRLATVALLAAVGASTLATPAHAAGTAYVSFYEGGSGTQAIVCSIPVPRAGAMGVRQIDFTNDPYSCDNDEARSMGFINSDPGLTVEVWDRSSCANPVGQSRSDYSRIGLAVVAAPRVVVGTFEATTPPVRGLPYYESYVRANGDLDGKVSCVRISRTQ
jgi:hypothetical protein